MGILVDGNGFYDNEDEYMLHRASSERLKSIVFWEVRSLPLQD